LDRCSGLLGGVAAILDVSHHWPIQFTVPAVMLLGIAIGMFNGWWSTYLRVPSFIVGLGGMLAYRGVLLGVTGGSTIAPVSSNLVFIGQGYLPRMAGNALAVVLFALLVALTVRQRQNRLRYNLPVVPLWQDGVKIVAAGLVLVAFVMTLNQYGGIPVPVLLLLALLGIFTYIATQTVFGRRIYAVGSNLEATRLSGVNTNRVKLMIFALMGLMCALAGLVNTARLAAGSPSAGTMGELDAIAACFHWRDVHARRIGDRLWRIDRGAGHGEPGQRHVDARCRFVLADDREGRHSRARGMDRCRVGI
jgi:D-xylose transport system permease protein